VCTFCAFYRRPGAPDTYVQTIESICEKIDETIELGGTGVLMQGGLHPDFGIEWYEDLLRTLSAKYPGFQLHCFSPPEIHNIHLISGLDYETIMQRLKDAGLQSAWRWCRDSRRRSAQTRRDQVHDAGVARRDARSAQSWFAIFSHDDVRHW